MCFGHAFLPCAAITSCPDQEGVRAQAGASSLGL
jgi:hypothetical protein